MTTRLIKILVSLALAFTVSLPPMVASAQSNDPLGIGITPEGRWRSENGDSRYDVTLCGDDGVSLCGKLVWIRPRDRNERNVQYVDDWVVYEAARAKPAEWRGNLNVYGTEYGGSVKMRSSNELLLTGCVFILCESYSFFRTRNPDGTPVAANTADE